MENTGFDSSNDGYYYHTAYPQQSVPPPDYLPPSAYLLPYSEVSYPPEYAAQASYYSAPPEVGYGGLPQPSVPVQQIAYPITTDPPPPVGDNRDDTARLMEEFIRKCKSKKNKERLPSPPPRRRSRSRSPRRSTSRGRCADSKPAAPFRPRSRTFRRSKSRDSRREYKDRSISSERSLASDDLNYNQKTKRKELLDRWRLNNCSSSNEMSDQLEEISKMKPEDIIEKEKHFWTRTAPADLYYVRCDENPKVSKGTKKLITLCEKFEYTLLKRSERAKEGKPVYVMPDRRHKLHHHKCCNINSESDSDPESGECSGDDEEEGLMEELERKKAHPDRLHPELWYNDPGEMNDGPLCRCSAKAKRSGIRHNIYAGELNLEKCDIFTNNADRLFHYRITVSPPTNFLIKTPTIIEHDNHEYIFEGFSMLSHKPLENLPVCKVIRFNIEYTILYIEEKLPEHFVIKELDLFYEYLFKEILEMVDLDFKAAGDSNGCSQFHFMPRFVRELPENGKELLSMNEVLSHLLASSKPLIAIDNLKEIINLSNYKWQNYVDDVKGMVATYPGKKPCSLRVDQLDRDQRDAKPGEVKVPEIVHFGIRPPQLSYAGNPDYQKAWRDYVKFRHLLANMPKASYEDKRKLESKENKLQEMRTQSKMKRDVTIAISAEGFYRTGIMCDIVQHAMLIPVLVSHLRFHRSLDVLEADIGYTFKNRNLLQLALTHPSYRENFGTNPDHARNSLTNCSIRQPEYGDRRIHYLNTRKRGINTLINIMSRFGKKYETESNITHNERLEFLGDAVVEFVTSIHLFHLFPRLEEGGLATYRAAIVQNQHLAVLAKKLGLDGYMLYAHGSDLCHDLELRHAMANCFEALMGALFLDGNIEAADKVFGESLFKESSTHLAVWVDYPPHPLQEQEPNGDRQWISKFKILQDLTVFEDSIGVQFTHIRLLARAFTDRSIGYTNLTLGSNQRLEFLGDTVLQLIASDYLYKYFPEHHEGHLSLLRSSLVNNRTQAVVCDDLGIATHAIYANPKAELKTKDRADLLEAFLGALYVDKGLRYCETFCNVCFFPRLHDFIMHQDWNDPKSKLQQCCLTLRTMEGGEPEIPIYKVIECMGPTNTRLYTVAVYFKGKRLAQATGHSIQQAEMNAAKEALENSQKLFPQLDHQKRVIAKSIKQDPPFDRDEKRNYLRMKEKRSPRKRDSEDARRMSQTRDSSSRQDSISNSKSTGGRSLKEDREKDRSRSLSTFNSHEDSMYRRHTRQESSSREPSCKSERSQSVRSSQSPERSLEYEDSTKKNVRSSRSPGRRLKDGDYTKRNLRCTRRRDSLSKVEDDKSSESDKHRMSTFNSHEDARYTCHTRQDSVRSSREPSCKSEKSPSVRSSRSPERSLRDEDSTKRNVRSSQSPGRRLKDGDYTKKNVRCTRRRDSLSKVEDDKSSESDKHRLSTFNSHEDVRYSRHTRQDSVRSSRESSCKSERSPSIRSSRSPGRSLRDEDSTKRNVRSSRSPGRRLKDGDYTERNVICTGRKNSLSKAEDDESSELDKHRLSTFNSHKDARYSRHTRQESVRSTREPSCKSERSPSVRSSQSPGRRLEDEDRTNRSSRSPGRRLKDEDHTKRNIRSSRSPGRRLKDGDYTNRNVRCTQRKDSLSKAEDDESSELDKHRLSTFNSHKDARYSRHTRQESVCSTREPSCKSEKSPSVRSRRSPERSLEDEDYPKRNVRTSRSPGRRLKDEDHTKRNVRSSRSTGRRLKDGDYTERNVICTGRKDSLSKAVDDESSELDKHRLSTFNSHKDARYSRHTRQESVRSTREPSCKSERSPSVRSRRSPDRSLRDEDYTKMNVRSGRSPGRTLKDEDTKKNVRCTRRKDSLGKAKDDESSGEDRSDSRHRTHNIVDVVMTDKRKESSTSNRKDGDIKSKDDGRIRAMSKSGYQEKGSHRNKDRRKEIDGYRTNKPGHLNPKSLSIDYDVRDNRHKKKRSCSIDSEEKHSKKRAVERRENRREDRKLPSTQDDVLGRSDDTKSPNSCEVIQTQADISGRSKNERRQKRRTPSDEGEIFSTSSSSP